jgi:hypothetical protein
MQNAASRWPMLLFAARCIIQSCRVVPKPSTLLPLVQPLVHDLSDLVLDLIRPTLGVLETVL